MKNRYSIIFLFALITGVMTNASADSSYKKKIYIKAYTPRNVALKSAFFPGWGQHENHRPGKGYMISGLFFTTLAASYVFNVEAQDAYADYRDTGVKDDALYDDYEQYRQASLIAGGIAAGVWIYGIVEAFFYARDDITRQQELTWRLYFDGNSSILACQKRF